MAPGRRRGPPPRHKLSACIRSGVPFPGEAELTSRLLYELLPVTLRNPTACSRQHKFVAEQASLYQQILEAGQEAGEFQLVADSGLLARNSVALEDGYGTDVLSEAATADEVAERLLHHARLITHVDDRAPQAG